MEKEIKKIENELGVSRECANSILYLRSRSRWTRELEKELIQLFKLGTPPNMMEFGVTEKTQQKMKGIVDKVSAKYKK
jgi:hypothetical protein